MLLSQLKWESVSESKRLRRRHRMTNGCQTSGSNFSCHLEPHQLDWAIFSAHCGCRCRFRFPSSQLFCNAACQVGCGLSAAKGQIRSPLSLPLFASLPLFPSLYLLSCFAVYLFLISISFFAISSHDSFLVNAMLVTCSHLFSGFAGGGNGVWLGEVGVHSALLLITWRKRRLITKLRAFVVYISVIQSEGQEC